MSYLWLFGLTLSAHATARQACMREGGSGNSRPSTVALKVQLFLTVEVGEVRKTKDSLNHPPNLETTVRGTQNCYPLNSTT